MKNYVIGLDFGTDTVRAVLLDTSEGMEMAIETFHYPRWKQGLYSDPTKNQYRQHPLDHIEGLEFTIKGILRKSNINPELVRSICVDTTGSSPIPLSHQGIPLALLDEFKENPNAMMILWKDHTSIKEAEEINYLAKNWGNVDYTKYSGGVYSTEWFWAKIAHIIRQDTLVKNAAYTWMEHCDLMTYLLIEDKNLEQFKRSRCAAGHKAMWHDNWGGLPAKDFLYQMDPYCAELRDRLYEQTYTSDQIAGHLSEEWANRLGLNTNVVVAVGTLDAHAGAIGAKAEEFSLVRVMGTSTCDIIVAQEGKIGSKSIKGICGQVHGSVIPGMIGLEAGQSAFGDALAWLKAILNWSMEHLVLSSNVLDANQKEDLQEEFENNFYQIISSQAENLKDEESIPIALDWINGRRSPDANQNLKAAISGLNLGTQVPHVYKAFVNAICFGSRKIVDRFEDEGVEIKSIIGIGGVARKSPFIMQTLANTLNRPIKIAASDQAPALGAAIYAAVAAGIYPSVIEASKILGSNFEAQYFPDPEKVKIQNEFMQSYNALAHFLEFQEEKHISHV